MKKVLFATTALVFSAGFAAAEVSLSGDGRMGVFYNGDDWDFSSRARVIFTLSGQTDGGLEFGGSFKTSNSYEAATGEDGSVYISGAFGKLEMGNVVSAPEALLQDLPEVGYTDLSSQDPTDGLLSDYSQGLLSNDIPYLTGDQAGHFTGGVTAGELDSEVLTQANNPELLYTYSTGPISLAASMSDGQYYAGGAKVDSQEYAVAAAYTFQNYTVGLGYEIYDPSGFDKQAQGELAGVATFGNTSVKAYYAWGDQENPVDQAYGLGVSSVFGATTVMGYVQKVELTDAASSGINALYGADVDSVTWYGIGASYDLGGGASITGGIADNDLDGTDPVADLGVKFTF